MSTEENGPGSGSPAPNDDAGAEKAPRKRARRRRKTSGRARPKSAAAPAEAGAFQDPPPVGDRSAPEGAAAGADAEPDSGSRVRRKRSKKAAPKKRRRSRKKAATKSSDGASEADGAEASQANAPDEAAAPKKRKRRRRSSRKSASEGPQEESAVSGGESLADTEAQQRRIPSLEEAGADEPAPDPKGRRRKRKRRSKRDGSKADAAGGESKGDGDGGAERRKSGRKRGDRKKSSRDSKKDAKRRDGKSKSSRGGERKRRDGRRGGDSRRDGRGRDPRAVDIVPRAPSPEEAAKEKILLVNAADQAEARIALLVDGVLEEIYVESATVTRSAAGNIYRGRVQNVERGIGAAFVDLGRGTTGFLHATDVPLKEGEEPGLGVTERLSPGDEVIVQITRDSIGRKGPALTGRISFPGRYLVLMPHTARSGISRRIPHGPDRDHVRKLLKKLNVPEGMGVIVRTASEATDLAALEADLDHLLRNWEFIKRKAAEPGQPGLLRSESDLAERSVRDIMPGDVKRIIVDKDELAGQIHRLLRVWYPSAAAAAEEAAHETVRNVTATLDTPVGELRLQEEQAHEDSSGEAAAGAEMPAAEMPEADVPEADVSDEDVSGDDAPEDETPSEGGEPAAEEDPSPDAPESDSDEPDLRDLLSEEAAADYEPPPLPGDELPAAELDDEPEPSSEDDEDEDDGAEAVVEETKAERLARLRRMARTMPEVELHTDPIPLFHHYGVETQLEDAFRRSIRLPSGGSIVIDPTEALVAVDVNSGRLTDEEDPESTALVTNLEAVTETARQLRVRDLGGLVVIDFIDMRDRRSRKKVEAAFRDALSGDRARIRMGRMGPFGLIVMSRQRIRQALSRVTHETCPSCGGTGNRRQVSGLGLRILREMKARIARSRGRGGLEVRAPQEVVSWLKKNGGLELKAIRHSCTGPISLQPDSRLASDGWAMKGLPPEGES